MHGLGLGVALNGAFLNGADHVTVIEKSSDVITLTGKYWQEKYGDRLTIIEGDAYTWKPESGKSWDIVWHDVWDNLCTDNLQAMAKLHRRFGRRCKWQGSWGYKLLKAKAASEKREARRWGRFW
jgi:predicted methyltransferase